LSSEISTHLLVYGTRTEHPQFFPDIPVIKFYVGSHDPPIVTPMSGHFPFLYLGSFLCNPHLLLIFVCFDYCNSVAPTVNTHGLVAGYCGSNMPKRDF